MRTPSPVWLFVVVLAIGCEKLIRADFDDAHPKPEGETQGGGTSSGGRGGTSSGGAATGGDVTGGAGTTNGGAQGGGATGGATMSGGAPAGGDAGDAGAGFGGSAGEAGMSGEGGTGGSGGSGGARSLNCNGAFDDLDELAYYTEITSLSVTADEKEFFIATDWPASSGRVYRFPVDLGFFTEVGIVEGTCPPDKQTMTVDISDDGLRLYFTCSASSDALLRAADPLWMADRTNRVDPFDRVRPIGNLPARFSLSSDELSAFASLAPDGVEPGRTLLWEHGPSVWSPSAIPGITDTHDLLDPEPSSDGLDLYGVLLPEYRFAVATRPNTEAAFGEPEPFIWSAPAGTQYISPSISADCRTLYFVRCEDATIGQRACTVLVSYREKCADGRDNDLDLDVDCDDEDCETDVACQ